MKNPEHRLDHLTDDELFGLAVPAAGVPEALPAHLSDCLACSRALLEWKAAARDLAADDGPLARRTPEQWKAAGDRTLAAIREARRESPRVRIRWTAAIAASLLLAMFAVPIRRAIERPRPAASNYLSPQDQADDTLLKDVAALSRGDDPGDDWDSLMPEPGTAARDAERL